MKSKKLWPSAALLLALAVVATRPATAQEAGGSGAPPTTPSLGDVVPVFDAQKIDGSTQHMTFPAGSKTVLLFFLSGCPTCHKMIPEWNRAWERRPKELRVIGVIMDQEPLGFFDAMPISFPVVRSPGREFLKGLKVNRAPLTLRVAAGGKIEDLGLGLLDPIRLGELFKK
jgi:thiol-disulfide isomerase/thioredoxin